MKALRIATLIIVTIALAQTATADKLCLQSTVNKKTFKVTNKSVVAAKCPKGYTELADTSSFQGPAGATGPAGARGPSAFDVIPSGTTVTGFIGQGLEERVASSVYIYASIPAKIPTPLVDSTVIIKANSPLLADCGSINCLSLREQADNHLCTGTYQNPTAPAGYVCIYPTSLPSNIATQTLEGVGLINNPTQVFGIYYEAGFSSYDGFEGTWAYTAP